MIHIRTININDTYKININDTYKNDQYKCLALAPYLRTSTSGTSSGTGRTTWSTSNSCCLLCGTHNNNNHLHHHHHHHHHHHNVHFCTLECDSLHIWVFVILISSTELCLTSKLFHLGKNLAWRRNPPPWSQWMVIQLPPGFPSISCRFRTFTVRSSTPWTLT